MGSHALVPTVDTPAGRSVAVDAVRALGLVAIVAGHTWDVRHFAQVGFYTWHVPVFFFLTGYLWKGGRSVADETRRRARTLLVPYIGWLLIVSVAWYSFRAALGEPFDTELLKHLPLGGNAISRPYSAFWFVTCLFVATVFLRWLDSIHPLAGWFVAAVGVAWCIGDRGSIANIPASAGTAMVAIFFMLIGRGFRTFRTSIDRPAVAGVLLAGLAGLLGVSGALLPLNMKAGNLGTPVLSVLMAAAISAGLLLFAEAVESRAPRAVKWVILEVAACALPVILLHTLSLAMTARLGLPSSKLTFLIALFGPLALAMALRRTPLRRWLF